MINTVTFDFWNTIFDSGNGKYRNAYRHKIITDEFEKHGKEVNPEEFKKAMEASWAYFNNIWKNDLRTPDPKDTISFFFDFLGLTTTEENITRVAKEFGSCILLYPPNLLPGVREVIVKLHADGFNLGIVSDTGFSTGTELKKLLENEKLAEYFSAFSFSDETKVSKPHPLAFKTVLDSFGINPENAVHIGDIEETDIHGAKNLGMKAIRYNGDPEAEPYKSYNSETKADISIGNWAEFDRAFSQIV